MVLGAQVIKPYNCDLALNTKDCVQCISSLS